MALIVVAVACSGLPYEPHDSMRSEERQVQTKGNSGGTNEEIADMTVSVKMGRTTM